MHEEDRELLRRYAAEKSEAAFAELVRRHLGLVYSVALRQCGGDAHLAQDVAQVVFTSLARKAAALAERPVLGGWLYRTTQFAAIDAVRAESRRRARETEATTMHETLLTPAPGAEPDWEKLRPTLDQAISELGDDDRDAVVLRFFEGQSFAAVGARLRLTENAARMRVDRALDKLNALLARRGVTSTAAALGVALANQAGVAAPAGLAASVTGAALAVTMGGGAAGAGGVMAFMSTAKTVAAIAGTLAILASGVAVFEVRQAREHESALAESNRERGALEVQLAEATKRTRLAERRAAEAEKDNGELLAAVGAVKAQAARGPAAGGTPWLDPREQDRLAQERAYQQELAKKRSEEARTRAELEHEASRLDAVAKFNKLIEGAEALAATAEFSAAVRLYNQAMAAKPADLPVPDRVRELQAVLKAQNAPVEITLNSDGVTWVSIRNSKAPAQFVTTAMKILPGNYEVRGTRRGYQDVVLPLQVRGGQPPSVLTVICTQPVAP